MYNLRTIQRFDINEMAEFIRMLLYSNGVKSEDLPTIEELKKELSDD